MPYTFEDYKKNADIMRKYIGNFTPRLMLILGSGLGAMADMVEDPVKVSYKFNDRVFKSAAPGHASQFVFGRLFGKEVCIMQGRLHCYEGYTAEESAFPVRMMRLLGAESLIVTNEAGCVNSSWKRGDIMIIDDHIKFQGESPLKGHNIDELGPRFPDMSNVYSPRLKDIAREAAAEIGFGLREGIYFYSPGPQYETPAEIRAMRVLGADAVGMSTVPEVIAGRHCGMEILGFSLLTNMAAGILKQQLTEEEVLESGAEAAERFSLLIKKCIEKI